MAEASISVSQDEFNCSICLDMLKDPVTIPCGHSFCMNCIKGYWEQPDQRRDCKCPMCKYTFCQRPVLYRNTILAEMMVKMKRAVFQPCPPVHTYAGPGDVPCDICTDRKLKAVQQCLRCQVTYCETHVKPHRELPAFESHTLTGVSERTWEICCDLPANLFCITDQECMCLRCLHNQHYIVSADEGMTSTQTLTNIYITSYEVKIQEREKEMEQLRKTEKDIKSSANSAVHSSATIFTELIGTIERERTAMTNLIRTKEKDDLKRVADFVKQVTVEITMLKQKYAELKQFSQTKNNKHFLENFQKICPSSHLESNPSVSVNSNTFYEQVKMSVQKMKQTFEETLLADLNKMSKVKQEPIVVSTEPLIRQDFLKYTTHIALDINTANKNLKLSDDNRQVTWSDEALPYPDLPQRFTDSQVLGKESLPTTSYWEVEWAGEKGVRVGVTERRINRLSRLEENDLSSSMFCSPSDVCFEYRGKTQEIAGPISNRLGVYVNFQTLSFYSVSDTMRLLHTERYWFCNYAFPVLWIGDGSTAKLC